MICFESCTIYKRRDLENYTRNTFFTIEKREGSTVVRTEKEGNLIAYFIDCGLADGEYLDGHEGMTITLSFPEKVQGILSLYREGLYWCRPAFPKAFEDVPSETQALFFTEEGKSITLLLPVVDKEYKATFEGKDLRIRSFYNGLSECHTLGFIQATGDNIKSLVRNAAAFAMKLTGRNFPLRDGRQFPEVLEYLGWCSWDALQIRVSEEGVLKKCQEFKEKKIPVKWMILDDMWEDTKGLYDTEHPDYDTRLKSRHQCALNSFEGDPYRFPKGLAHCIKEAKKKYDVDTGIWHTYNGYWKGIDKEGRIAEELHDILLEVPETSWPEESDLTARSKAGQLVPDYHRENAFQFFNSWHQFLKNAGAKFLKVDNQSTMRLYYSGLAPIGEYTREIHAALDESAKKNFGNAMINCMGMASENMWNRPSSSVSRCSDDFLPNNSDWFAKHLLMCAYNSLLQGEFLWCDYDMFWSGDPQGLKNSVIRALSGGPVYISDKLYESVPETILPLTLSNGRILRADVPGIPSNDCLFENPAESGKPFKMYTYASGALYVGAFNLDNAGRPVKGSLRLSDFLLEKDDAKSNRNNFAFNEYIVYERFTGLAAIISKDDVLSVSLCSASDYRLYAIVHLENQVVILGLTEKYIGSKTFRDLNNTDSGAEVTVLEGGTLLFYAASAVAKVLCNGVSVPCSPVKEASDGFFLAKIPDGENLKVSISVL